MRRISSVALRRSSGQTEKTGSSRRRFRRYASQANAHVPNAEAAPMAIHVSTEITVSDAVKAAG